MGKKGSFTLQEDSALFFFFLFQSRSRANRLPSCKPDCVTTRLKTQSVSLCMVGYTEACVVILLSRDGQRLHRSISCHPAKKEEQEQAFQYTVSLFIAVCSISAGVIGLSQEELRTGKVPNEPKL